MNRRTQFGLVWFLLGILFGMLVISLFPGVITYLVLALTIGVLAAIVEMRTHIVQRLLRRQSGRTTPTNQPPLRASQYQSPPSYRRRRVP